MSLVGKTVSYWETEFGVRPAIVVDDSQTDALLHVFQFGNSETDGYDISAARAETGTEGCWTEPETGA